MSNPNDVIANTPVPINDSSTEMNKEVILKEDFNKERIKNINSGNFSIILPDEVKVKEEEHAKKLK